MYIWVTLNYKETPDDHIDNNANGPFLKDEVDETNIFNHLDLFDFSDRYNKATKETNTIFYVDRRHCGDVFSIDNEKEECKVIGKFFDKKLRENLNNLESLFDNVISIFELGGGNSRVRPNPFGYTLELHGINQSIYDRLINYFKSI
jgi:hypothetical protein